MLKKAILALFIATLAHLAWAVDLYNEKNGQLSIPLVSANGTTYTDVVISIGEVVAVNGGSPSSTIDFYDSATNRLNIPSVNAYGKTYTNVVVTVAGIVSVGGGTRTTSTVSGVATDGYIGGAQVCMDLNDNGKCDSGEPTATTSVDGSYQLSVSKTDVGNHQLLLIATAGQATDADVSNSKILKSFVLATPKEYTGIISPLTTAVVATKNATNTNTATAAATVFQTLDLSDGNLNANHLFNDFSSTSNQQSNPSLIKLANFAKAINVNIANQALIEDSAASVSSVIGNAATTKVITQNIINSSLINSINSSTPITTQNLQASLISSEYRDAMRKIDGLWFGTYFDKTKNKTYQLCRSQGDMIITADGWISIFGTNNQGSCPHSGNASLGILIRASFKFNPNTQKITIQNGFVMNFDATGTIIESVAELAQGKGDLANISQPNTVSTALSISFDDGSSLTGNWDPATSTPKTAVVQNFNLTAGQYVGRASSDAAGSDFNISSTGSISGTLKQALPAPINKTYTCEITPNTGYLIPGFTGYYIINNMSGECTAIGSSSRIKKTWNGYAIPVHAGPSPYGARKSIVGDQDAASIVIMLFDASNNQLFFGLDNIPLQ